jgi:hypothetical protein
MIVSIADTTRLAEYGRAAVIAPDTSAPKSVPQGTRIPHVLKHGGTFNNRDAHLCVAKASVVEARDGIVIGTTRQHIVLLPVVTSFCHSRILAPAEIRSTICVMSKRRDQSPPVPTSRRDTADEQASLCLLPDQPTTTFTYVRPEDHRDPMPADERFLRACGVHPPDLRDELRVLDRRPGCP